jgi:hypothetical protein
MKQLKLAYHKNFALVAENIAGCWKIWPFVAGSNRSKNLRRLKNGLGVPCQQ